MLLYLELRRFIPLNYFVTVSITIVDSITHFIL